MIYTMLLEKWREFIIIGIGCDGNHGHTAKERERNPRLKDCACGKALPVSGACADEAPHGLRYRAFEPGAIAPSKVVPRKLPSVPAAGRRFIYRYERKNAP